MVLGQGLVMNRLRDVNGLVVVESRSSREDSITDPPNRPNVQLVLQSTRNKERERERETHVVTMTNYFPFFRRSGLSNVNPCSHSSTLAQRLKRSRWASSLEHCLVSHSLTCLKLRDSLYRLSDPFFFPRSKRCLLPWSSNVCGRGGSVPALDGKVSFSPCSSDPG